MCRHRVMIIAGGGSVLVPVYSVGPSTRGATAPQRAQQVIFIVRRCHLSSIFTAVPSMKVSRSGLILRSKIILLGSSFGYDDRNDRISV